MRQLASEEEIFEKFKYGSEQSYVLRGTHMLNKCCLWSLLLLLGGASWLAIKQMSRVVVVVAVVVVVVVVVVQNRMPI